MTRVDIQAILRDPVKRKELLARATAFIIAIMRSEESNP